MKSTLTLLISSFHPKLIFVIYSTLSFHIGTLAVLDGNQTNKKRVVYSMRPSRFSNLARPMTPSHLIPLLYVPHSFMRTALCFVFAFALFQSQLFGAASGNTVAELVYIPETGKVFLDGECAAGGVITNFVLFSNGEFINTGDVVNPYGSAFFTSNADEVSASDGNGVGLPLIDLGNILPTDLTLADLNNIFTGATYVGELGSGQFDLEFRIGQLPDPVEVIVSDGEAQRSMLLEIEVVFPGVVQIDNSAFSMIQTGGTAVGLSFSTASSNGNTIATISFSGNHVENSGSLEDGNYQLTIDGAGVLDAQGNNFDVDRDGIPGGQLVFGDEEAENLYRFFGDFNLNRTVNVFDLLGFRQTYRLMTGDASFDSSFDSNLDGIINVFDLLRFRQNYRLTLAFDDGS